MDEAFWSRKVYSSYVARFRELLDRLEDEQSTDAEYLATIWAMRREIEFREANLVRNCTDARGYLTGPP